MRCDTKTRSIAPIAETICCHPCNFKTTRLFCQFMEHCGFKLREGFSAWH